MAVCRVAAAGSAVMTWSARRRGEAGRAGGAATVFAYRLPQVRLEGAESVAFDGRQVRSFSHQVNQRLHLLELRCGVEPDRPGHLRVPPACVLLLGRRGDAASSWPGWRRRGELLNPTRGTSRDVFWYGRGCPRVPGGGDGERATAPGLAAGAAARRRRRRPPVRRSQDGPAVAERARAVPAQPGRDRRARRGGRGRVVA